MTEKTGIERQLHAIWATLKHSRAEQNDTRGGEIRNESLLKIRLVFFSTCVIPFDIVQCRISLPASTTITTVILIAGFGHAEIVGEREICIKMGKEVMPHIVVGRLSWFFFYLIKATPVKVLSP
jgi:hypothetical protein